MSTEAIDRHYLDDELSALAATARVEEDAHLRSCRDCAEKLEAFQLIAEALHDGAVWDTAELRTEPVPSTVAALRAFADAMAEDDAYAEEVLPELLAGGRESWMPRLEQHPEWRSAGVVRKLVEAASRAIDTMPPDAVEMTALATSIAERLDEAEYDRDTTSRLCGAAWRERAYALYYTGRFIDADEAVRVSERHFSECSTSDYDLARLGIVRALVFRALERFDAAQAAASGSAKTFAAYGDIDRTVSAGLAEAQLLFSKNAFERAEEILLDLSRRVDSSDRPDTHARVLGNLAYCYREMGQVDLAVRYYDLTSAIFDSLGVPTEAARTLWSAAVLLGTQGRIADAQQRLIRVHSEFNRLGMTSEAAIADLDRAELFLAQGRYAEVAAICSEAIRSFEAAGVPYSARVRTALAFMREAAQQRNADQALARKVKEYIRRAPREPQLLFAPAVR